MQSNRTELKQMETADRKAGETRQRSDWISIKTTALGNTAELSKYDCAELITPLRDRTILCCLWVWQRIWIPLWSDKLNKRRELIGISIRTLAASTNTQLLLFCVDKNVVQICCKSPDMTRWLKKQQDWEWGVDAWCKGARVDASYWLS